MSEKQKHQQKQKEKLEGLSMEIEDRRSPYMMMEVVTWMMEE